MRTEKERAQARERQRRYLANPENREKSNERARLWRAANPHEQRRRHLRQKYGMALEDYTKRLTDQGGGCAVCGITPDEPLVVDYCHQTEIVRALLCHRCNAAIGMFQDNPERMRAGADYIERFRQ